MTKMIQQTICYMREIICQTLEKRGYMFENICYIPDARSQVNNPHRNLVSNGQFVQTIW